MKQTKDYGRLKQMLQDQEAFPHVYLHKFIGKNSAGFLNGVAALEKAFPKAKQQARRPSEKGNHIALTYLMEAGSADEIIELLQATDLIEDLLYVL